MSLVVEDGQGRPDAQSYVSVSDATAYHASRGNSAWGALSEPEKEAALIRATDYMRGAYRMRWRGYRANSVQALDWPRLSVVVDGYPVAPDSVPADVANACCELALRASSGELAPDLTQGIVQRTVDVITTVYDTTSPQATRFRAVDQLLAPYLSGAGAFARLERA